jgi:beta-galactosidase
MIKLNVPSVALLWSAVAGAATLPLTGQWKLSPGDDSGAEQIDADDSGWQAVVVPHTWNNLDGEDGGNNYLKTTRWYRRHFDLTNKTSAGKNLFLRFEGANRTAEVFVNGQKVGQHTGGFGAFCFDITKAAHSGDNVIAVRVSNKPDAASPPISADFTFFGGIYRPIELISLAPMHFCGTDHASPGVSIVASDISDEQATITVTAAVHNGGDSQANVQVVADIVDAGGDVVLLGRADVTVERDSVAPAKITLMLPHPHRWNGRHDPYLYHVNTRIMRGGAQLDTVTQPLGIRTYSIDEKRGFILNGQPYDLHGVNRHQDRPDKGWAISDEDIRQDFALMKEMGCTALRLSHYQQADVMYQLADEAGIVVWAEVPVVNELRSTPAFIENAHDQLLDLIRQNINHPSICFWSLGNEVTARRDDRNGKFIDEFFNSMNDIAKREDPSRLTTVAWRPESKRPGVSDVFGENPYFGWYNGIFMDFEPWLAKQPPRMAVSEYGAGASIYYHSEHPIKMDHTEEYQCLFHEFHWAVMERHPELWGKFIWAMFDFSSDYRKEGDHAGRNDKGLVTYDRQTRKDAFYFYKANWSDEPVLHLNSKRFAVRGLERIAVRAYSNAPEAELTINGVSAGTQTGEHDVFVWPDVPLKPGENQAIVTATRNGVAMEDHCTWTYQPGAPTDVFVPQDDAMKADLLKGLPGRPRKRTATSTTQPADALQ